MFHAAAIGDAVLATPVSVKLKQALPNVRISYMTHASLFPLLKLCTSIDNFYPYDKTQPVFQVRDKIASLKADLVVDLSGSLASMVRTAFTAPTVLTYKKRGEKSRRVIHAVDNFLETISSLNLPDPPSLFPSLVPDDQLRQKNAATVGGGALIRVAMVPGVGALRPHRAWQEDRWVELAANVLATGRHEVILIGGKEELALCQRIAEEVGERCHNLAGKLSLPETAAMLQQCVATVSGDTGPAHISVAVGTAVVGIYGPTLPSRSGPYGMSDTTVDVSASCSCLLAKCCKVSGPSQPGACLREVTCSQVLSRLQAFL